MLKLFNDIIYTMLRNVWSIIIYMHIIQNRSHRKSEVLDTFRYI